MEINELLRTIYLKYFKNQNTDTNQNLCEKIPENSNLLTQSNLLTISFMHLNMRQTVRKGEWNKNTAACVIASVV